MTAIDLGRIVTYLLNKRGDTVTHKKLQKLLYYIDAWHLVYFEYPLIEEDFQAWVHGPVLPSLYEVLKDSGFNNPKVVSDDFDPDPEHIEALIESSLSVDQLDLIDSVLNKYGNLTAFELEMLAHSEAPWIEARKGLPPHIQCRHIITKGKMKEFYESMIKE
jgi:uncharacterized phage-associated protein